ncbi:MAG: SDR family oxidoreductase [Myxococcota bacterium]
MGRLQGRVALVTGGSRGIGLALARALRAESACVALVARGRGDLERAAAELGPDTLPLVADISDPDAVRRSFRELERRFGRLDMLINNAALSQLHKLEEASDEDLARAVGANLMGVLYCVREAIPMLRRSEQGEILNISSESVQRPFPYLSVYAATKGAIEVLSLALRQELRPDGIRVTLFRTGASASEGLARDWPAERAARAIELWKEQGLLEFAGQPMPTEVVAESIVHALTRPHGSSVDFLELRSWPT